MPGVGSGIFVFDGFRFDRRGGGLFRIDSGAQIPVGSRALDILGVLLARAGDLVSKAELMTAVWPHTVVDDGNLTVQISALRRILDDGRSQSSAIMTVPGRGYRFVVAVTGHDPGSWRSTSPLLDKPSIAVLPFKNLSSDPEQEYFADGIAEDVITALSRYPSLFVIARSSCLTYKGRTVEVRQVGCELGVRYVLEGSLRKSGSRVRVTAQLVDAESGNHVWAERYDRDVADIFAVQDEISGAVTIAMAPAITGAEQHRAMRKPPESLDAWAAYQRGLWHLGKLTKEDNSLADRFFQQAVELDPTFAGGHWGLANAQFEAASIFRTGSLADAQLSAERSARRAVDLDGTDAEARASLGYMLLMRGDYEGALSEARRALAIAPNLAIAHGVLGGTLTFSGQPKDALASLEMCIRLDPLGPASAIRWHNVGQSLYFCGEYEAAVVALQRNIEANPNHPLAYRWLAASLGQLGRAEEANEALEKTIAIAPVSFDTHVRERALWLRPEDHVHMLEGLRKAGWAG
jgi:adenylate cyclase